MKRRRVAADEANDSMNAPDRAGFLLFIRNVMGINSTNLPDNSMSIDYALTVALELVNLTLAQISCVIYTLSVYNLAGDNLINYAQDQPGLTYFVDLRASYGSLNFVAGVIQSAGDEGTSESILTPVYEKFDDGEFAKS